MSEVLKRVKELKEVAEECAMSTVGTEYTSEGLGARHYAIMSSTNMILMALLELEIWKLTQQEEVKDGK